MTFHPSASHSLLPRQEQILTSISFGVPFVCLPLLRDVLGQQASFHSLPDQAQDWSPERVRHQAEVTQ